MNDFILVSDESALSHEISFVTCRTSGHRTQRELFMNMYHVFQKLKEITHRPHLTPENVEFLWKEDLTMPGMTLYTCKLKHEII